MESTENYKTLNLRLTDAQKLYWTGTEEVKKLVLSSGWTESELVDNVIDGLPKTWEEAKTILKKEKKTGPGGSKSEVFGRLVQIRNIYRGGWKPKLTDTETQYAIQVTKAGFTIEQCKDYKEIFSFPDYKVADAFLTNFQDLLEELVEIY